MRVCIARISDASVDEVPWFEAWCLDVGEDGLLLHLVQSTYFIIALTAWLKRYLLAIFQLLDTPIARS